MRRIANAARHRALRLCKLEPIPERLAKQRFISPVLVLSQFKSVFVDAGTLGQILSPHYPRYVRELLVHCSSAAT